MKSEPLYVIIVELNAKNDLEFLVYNIMSGGNENIKEHIFGYNLHHIHGFLLKTYIYKIF